MALVAKPPCVSFSSRHRQIGRSEHASALCEVSTLATPPFILPTSSEGRGWVGGEGAPELIHQIGTPAESQLDGLAQLAQGPEPQFPYLGEGTTE